MTDITELAQKPTRYGTNSQGAFTNQTDGAYVSYLDYVALVEALEKAQAKADVYDMLRDYYGLREKGVGLADFVDWQANRIAELESRAVKIVDCDFDAVQHMSGGSTDYCHGFVDGTQNAIRAITATSIKVEAE